MAPLTAKNSEQSSRGFLTFMKISERQIRTETVYSVLKCGAMSLSTSSDVAAQAAAEIPAQHVAALREAAADYVSRATGFSLDGSEESLAIVDHYIERVREKTGAAAVKPQVLRLVAAALGVYLGELCISRYGGSWTSAPEATSAGADADAESDDDDVLPGWRVALAAAPMVIDPLGMAAAALSPHRDDTADDDFGFRLLPAHADLYEPLHAALSRLAPVAADYYYSLTGRFETLGYVVDLVMELQHLRAAAAAAPSGDGPEAAGSEPPTPR
jgi:hypothetical protein